MATRPVSGWRRARGPGLRRLGSRSEPTLFGAAAVRWGPGAARTLAWKPQRPRLAAGAIS